jgi:hypothetical protein
MLGRLGVKYLCVRFSKSFFIKTIFSKIAEENFTIFCPQVTVFMKNKFNVFIDPKLPYKRVIRFILKRSFLSKISILNLNFGFCGQKRKNHDLNQVYSLLNQLADIFIS